MHLAIVASSTQAQRHASSGSSQTRLAEEAARIESDISDSISQGIADLTEMAPCHHFAEQALNILRYLAMKWNIDVDIGPGEQPLGDYSQLVRPTTSSLNFFAPSLEADDFICVWGNGGGQPSNTGAAPLAATAQGLGLGRGQGWDRDSGSDAAAARGAISAGSVGQAAEAIENPLFWPFPLQGRPMLPTGAELKDAGFELI
jgi:hypothetical protein